MASEKVNQFLSNPGIAALRSRITAGGGSANSKDILKALASKPTMDPETVVWRENDAFVIPEREIMEASLFDQKVRTNSAYGFHVTLNNNDAKNAYMSGFVKAVMPYKVDETTGEYVRNGEVVRSTTDFGAKCRALGTHLDIFNYICDNAGKTIRVKKVDEVITAARTYDDKGNSVITGLTKTRVPHFELEDA